ncbi:MAG: TetR/AcrR family transcriptional regulator [Myxococcales bacterium]|nr:TetR/AcrR family transcriptional regulator [Myxococcales bacterium]
MEMRLPIQSRALATRVRIVEASAQRLVEAGLAGAGTPAVAQGAGMSQGAVFKHFPTKTHLLAETVAHLLRGLVIAFKTGLPGDASHAPLEARVEVGVASLWRVFRSDELRAVFEVYVVARTDPALEALLEPVLAAHRARIHEEAQALFPELASHADSSLVIDAVVYAMQGAAVGLFGPALRDDAQNLAFFRRLALRELAHLLSQ